MAERRTARVQSLAGIGVDRMGALAARQEESSIAKPAAGDVHDRPLRMEDLDTDVPPNPVALEATTKCLTSKEDNSYLSFIGQLGFRKAAAAHVSQWTGNVAQYSGEANCVITAGGLSGIFNTLFATVEPGEGPWQEAGRMHQVGTRQGRHTYLSLVVELASSAIWSLS